MRAQRCNVAGGTLPCSFDDLEVNYYFIGPVFLMCFYTAASFIALNLFTAIVIDSYNMLVAKNEEMLQRPIEDREPTNTVLIQAALLEWVKDIRVGGLISFEVKDFWTGWLYCIPVVVLQNPFKGRNHSLQWPIRFEQRIRPGDILEIEDEAQEAMKAKNVQQDDLVKRLKKTSKHTENLKLGWARGELRPFKQYRVTVQTADVRFAGTDANAWVRLEGKAGVSAKLELTTSQNKNKFERAQVDCFVFTLEEMGELKRLTLIHDGDGPGSGWMVEKLTVHEATPKSYERRTIFAFNEWLDKDRKEVCLEPTSVEELEPPKGGPYYEAMRRWRALSRGMKEYKVQVATASERYAGTDANANLIIFGEFGDTGVIDLARSDRKVKFERGQTDTFVFTLPDVGELIELKLAHDGVGPGSAWFVDKVSVTAVSNDLVPWTTDFECHRWLDRNTSLSVTLAAGKSYISVPDFAGVAAGGTATPAQSRRGSLAQTEEKKSDASDADDAAGIVRHRFTKLSIDKATRQALRTYYKACNGVTAPDTVATVAKTLQLDVSDVRLFFTLHRKKRKQKGAEKPMFSSAHHDSAAVH